jgi:outer membrane protein OmpA-like peptidoglycan-associated protein
MGRGQHAALSAVLAVVIGAAGATVLPDRAGLRLAQAQAADDKDKDKDRGKGDRSRQRDDGGGGERSRSAPPPSSQPPPRPRVTAPPPSEQPPPQPRVTAPPPSQQQFERRALQKDKTEGGPGPSSRERGKPSDKPSDKPAGGVPPDAPTARPLETRTQDSDRRARTPPTDRGKKSEGARLRWDKDKDKGPGGPATAAQRPPLPKHFEDLQKSRQVRIEDGGKRKVISEPGNRFIVKERDKVVIRHDLAEAFRRKPGAKSERRGDGTVETYYLRRDGARVISVVDARGRLLRRYWRGRDGREHNIIDNRRFYRNLVLGVLGIVALNLAPPYVNIPPDEYIVDYEDASDDDVYEALDAPPIEVLGRGFALDEILDNEELRARARSVDIDAIDFDYGSSELSAAQAQRLGRLARAILRVLRDNPDAVFLIEGYSDDLGDEDNDISLAQSRAEEVANVLTDRFDVPPENLVAQGYAERPRGAPPDGLITVRNITRLLER